ncbi:MULTISPECIES: hypothetical protein [Staphylococcaceae]|uniref:Uncharacterized protein n=1 Tax=Macrococcus equipercicus TaxID=69967 RepID=A0A9Q9F1B3_9STAP|nr:MULTISPECIES: hypothetical protein [Macrococcus]MBC9873943.1 hypothetical protein [Macrococcus bohemicus]UTH13843.1 hypothetical protein KFV11_00240 [Macrococcus equipercicus]
MAKFNKKFFNKTNLGHVGFEIHNVQHNSFMANNVQYDVYNFDLTLTEKNGKIHRLPNYTMFIDQKNISFNEFVDEYCEVIHSDGFDYPYQLIGITGHANHYVSKKNHDSLNSWQFNVPSGVAQQQLQQHVLNNQQAAQNIQFNNHNDFNQQHQTEFHQTDADVVENPEFYGNPWEGQEND